MISGQLPSVDPSSFRPFRIDQDADDRPAGAIESVAKDGLVPRDHRRIEPAEEANGFLRSAKHMVKEALKDFRDGVKDTLKDMGLDKGLASDIANAVFKPVGDAFRSGSSFTANLMFAAVSATRDAAGSAFSFAARSIEIEVNFETGTVDVTSIDLAIEGQTLTAGGATPQLLDITDTAPDIPRIPDLFGQLREIISDLLGPDEKSDAPNDIGLAKSSTPDAAPSPDAATPAPDAAAAAAADPTPAETTPPVVPAELEEAINNLPDYQGSVRISVVAFEFFSNERNQQMLRLRLNATVPLTPPAETKPEIAAPQNDAVKPAALSA
jgi:hypothetical protein